MVEILYNSYMHSKSKISSHKRKLLKESTETPPNITSVSRTKEWNCRGEIINCPLEGGCLIKSIIYNAEVISNQDKVEYIGLAANNFKERFLNHISSFRNVRYKDSTALSNYVWNLKNKKEDFSIKWSIAAKAPSYHSALLKKLRS